MGDQDESAALLAYLERYIPQALAEGNWTREAIDSLLDDVRRYGDERAEWAVKAASPTPPAGRKATPFMVQLALGAWDRRPGDGEWLRMQAAIEAALTALAAGGAA